MEENFHFKKKFGQNFLRDPYIVERIAKSAQIKDHSLVIEVGPGKGILTRYLAQDADWVLCYEIDTELKEHLETSFAGNSHVTIKFKDFLTADIEADIKPYSYQNLYFVSNVPYYITTPILMKLMQSSLAFSNIVMMVQKEVGMRFCSLPGSRDYSSISVYLNYFYHTKILFSVGRHYFVPQPNVDSVVISLVPREEKLEVRDLSFFFQLVRDSFQFKRKTLRNNLKKYSLDTVLTVLEKYGYDLTVRAENLSVEVFVDLANALSE